MPFKHLCRYRLPRQPALTSCVRKSNSGLHKFTLAMELVIFKHYKSVPVVVLAHSKWMTFESVIHIDSKAARLWVINPNIARIAICARLLLVIDCLTHCEIIRRMLLCCPLSNDKIVSSFWQIHSNGSRIIQKVMLVSFIQRSSLSIQSHSKPLPVLRSVSSWWTTQTWLSWALRLPQVFYHQGTQSGTRVALMVTPLSLRGHAHIT